MKQTAFLALALLTGPSLHAAVTEYTDLSTFLAQLAPGSYTESFASLAQGDQAATSLPFSGGSPLISLTIATRDAANLFPGDNLYVAGLGDVDKALGTSTTQSDQLRIGASGLYAIAGEWFLSDIDDNYVPGTVDLLFGDASSFAVVSSTAGDSFRGYISDTPFTSLLISGPGTDYVTVDNLVAGSPIPEPTTGLWVLSVLGYAATARRRAARS